MRPARHIDAGCTARLSTLPRLAESWNSSSRSIILAAENESQHAEIARPVEAGGYGLDGLWNDDFHHSAIVALTGKSEAYYSDYRGVPQEFVSAVKYGFLFQSEDKKATVVLVEVKSPFQDPRNLPLVSTVEAIIKKLKDDKKIPDGLEVGITGSATAGRDLDLAEAAGAKTIERWTIAIVIILLVGLYRAPLVALIPLLRSNFFGPMATALMGGITSATVLTLFYVPALYAIWFRVRGSERDPLPDASAHTGN